VYAWRSARYLSVQIARRDRRHLWNHEHRGALVPVDANAPGPRLWEIGRQCSFRALITSHELYQKLSGSSHHEYPMNAIYFIDKAPKAALLLPALTFADNLRQQSSDDHAVPVIDKDLAYVLFTSGSASFPRDVMPLHLNALTFVN